MNEISGYHEFHSTRRFVISLFTHERRDVIATTMCDCLCDCLCASVYAAFYGGRFVCVLEFEFDLAPSDIIVGIQGPLYLYDNLWYNYASQNLQWLQSKGNQYTALSHIHVLVKYLLPSNVQIRHPALEKGNYTLLRSSKYTPGTCNIFCIVFNTFPNSKRLIFKV